MAKKFVKNPIHPVRKAVIGCILAVILAFIWWFIMLVYNLNLAHVFDDVKEAAGLISKEEARPVSDRILGIDSSVSQLAISFQEAYDNYYAQCQTKADLSARVNYDMISERGDRGIMKSGKGGIIKVEDGTVTLAEGMRSGIKKHADKFTKRKGTFIYDTKTLDGVRKDVLAFSHIRGPYYYVEIFNGKELLSYIRDYVNYIDILKSVEYAYDVDLHLICPNREKSRYFFNYGGNLIYASHMIEENADVWENAEDYGLPSTYEKLQEYSQNELTVGVLHDGETEYYDTRVLEIEELECVLVVWSKQTNVLIDAITQSAFGLGAILMVCVVFIVWVTSAYQELQQGILTEEKKRKYSPSNMRLVAVCYGVLGALAIFGSSLFIRSLSSIYMSTDDMKNTLVVMSEEIDRRQDYQKKIGEARKKLYLDYATRAAELLEQNPKMRSKEELEELSRIIGAEYIMLFDSQGVETATSSNYINVELGKEDAKVPSSTADFRRLLKGVPGISHSAYPDEVTGRTLELYGVRMTEAGTGLYGALLLAVEPEEITETEETMEINGAMMTLTPVGRVSFTMSPGKDYFVNASNEDFYYGYTPADLNLTKAHLRDGVIDNIKIDGTRYLIVSVKAREQDIYYYICSPASAVYGDAYRYGFNCAIGFAVLFVILSMYLLGGYRNGTLEALEKERGEKKEAEAADREPEVPDDGVLKAEAYKAKAPEAGVPDAQKSPGQEGTEAGPAAKKTPLFGKLRSVIYHVMGNMTPERKALLAFQLILAFVILRVVLRSPDYGAGRQDVLSYVVSGKWNKGFNLFAITSIVMLFCSLELAMMFVRFVLNIVGKLVSSRGKTICKLIANLFSYVSIMIFFYYALSYLGVDTNAILASVGVIGIGISMGARDLIADIFAGVSMIFEGEYQVGDIVSIDGYRGMVEEIGVRSTRLIGRGGNIKVIGNKDIKSLTNLTKMNSWVAVTIKVDVTYPLKDAEEILATALPRIGESCEYIISGPYYKGVLSVEMGFAVLSIIAECKEDDYHKVERVLVREVLLALREKDVPVR